MIETWGTEIALVIGLASSAFVYRIARDKENRILWLGKLAMGLSWLAAGMYLFALMNGVNL